MNKVVKKKLNIKGMHCSSCAMSIDFDLEDLDGVKTAKTSYAKGECQVEFEQEKVEVKTLIKTIEKSGYKAALV